MQQERRRSPRHPFGRVAAIVFGQRQEHRCLVKDFSDGGVRLQPNGFEIPMTSRCCLHPTSQPEAYKVVWRLGRDVGAKFIGPASLPNGHDARRDSAVPADAF